MKAVTYDKFGSIDELHVADIPQPEPSKGQVLIAVRATSVNVIDSRTRSGMMGLLVNKKFPKIPGSDVSGVVTALGPGVKDLKVGDEVYGAADPFKGGAFAESIAVPVDQLTLKPKQLSFEDAAALPVTGLAALISLRDLGKVKAGDKVLIHGASGALGLFAIQIGKQMGATVSAVVGTSAVAVARSLGADEVIDYTTQEGTTFGQSFDVIINASGKLPFNKAKPFLKTNGRMIEPSPTIPVFIGSKIANLFRQKKHLMLQTFPRRADLDGLSKMVSNGTLKASVAKTFKITEAKQAFQDMEKGGIVGKVIVTV